MINADSLPTPHNKLKVNFTLNKIKLGLWVTLTAHFPIIAPLEDNKTVFVITKNTLFRLALAVAVVVISYLVFSRPTYSQSIPNLDKIGHLGSFFCLSYLTYLAFRPRWYWLSLVLAGYAILIELVQSRLPYRSASMGDVLADFMGIASFYFCLWAYGKYFRAAQLRED